MDIGRRCLEGKTVLVTGATRGIGRSIADTFAAAGARVAITSRNENDCRITARQIEETYQVDVLGAACDVASCASVHELFLQLAAWSGNRLEVLVNNAGYPMNAEIWNMRLHEAKADALERWFLDIFRSDCMGAVFCTRAALQWMVPAGGGSIIYLVSTPALEGYRGSPYTAAKGAVLGLMRDVACEYGRHGIRANALALGNIETPATIGSLDERTRRLLADEAPLGRWGKPQEVADAALFLGSDRSGFITGQTLVVDGGTVRR